MSGHCTCDSGVAPSFAAGNAFQRVVHVRENSPASLGVVYSVCTCNSVCEQYYLNIDTMSVGFRQSPVFTDRASGVPGSGPGDVVPVYELLTDCLKHQHSVIDFVCIPWKHVLCTLFSLLVNT